MSVIEELFEINKREIQQNRDDIKVIQQDKPVSGFTYGFIESTLAEALAFPTTTWEVRIITNARKSGEGAGVGTGLPAFYDPSSAAWLDFSGSAIIV
jgi:hypothetical protein